MLLADFHRKVAYYEQHRQLLRELSQALSEIRQRCFPRLHGERSKVRRAFDMPKLDPVKVEAKGLIAFPDAISAKAADENKFVHFFVDDWRFERFWNNPYKYLEKLKQYAG